MDSNYEGIFVECVPSPAQPAHEMKGTHYTGGAQAAGMTKLIPLTKEAIAQLQKVIAGFERPASLSADEYELELSLGMTAEGKICVLSANSSLGVKVTMKWKKGMQ